MNLRGFRCWVRYPVLSGLCLIPKETEQGVPITLFKIIEMIFIWCYYLVSNDELYKTNKHYNHKTNILNTFYQIVSHLKQCYFKYCLQFTGQLKSFGHLQTTFWIFTDSAMDKSLKTWFSNYRYLIFLKSCLCFKSHGIWLDVYLFSWPKIYLIIHVRGGKGVGNYKKNPPPPPTMERKVKKCAHERKYYLPIQ